jgi:hypothetical protein
MGIAERFLWPIACLVAALSSALALERSPRQPQLILPPGLGIGIGLEQTGQQEPLLQTSTLFNGGAAGNFWSVMCVGKILSCETGQRGGNNTCGPRIADAGTIGLNVAFPELTIALSVNLPLNEDFSVDDEPCEYDPDMDLTTASFCFHSFLKHWIKLLIYF